MDEAACLQSLCHGLVIRYSVRQTASKTDLGIHQLVNISYFSTYTCKVASYTCEVASYTREVASSKLYNSFLSHIHWLCKTSNPFFHSCIVFSFFVQLKPEHLSATMIPPERIHQFIDSNMPESVIVVCFCPPSFFLSSRIIFSSASLSYDPTILCFSSLPYVSAIFFCRIGRFSKVH